MLTGKQRAMRRGMANVIEPIFQIGKNGINENFIKQLDQALEARELVKVTVLETAFMTTRDACGICAERTGAQPVQCIGFKFVLYRMAKEKKNRKIELMAKSR